MERDELCGRSLGEFVLRERIGEGGFGAVYRCEQPLLGREAVVKVLHRKLRASETAMQRFLREAKLASRLDHPYAAHVYAFGVEKQDGLLWIAMEMVHGTPLDQWLRQRGPLQLAALVPLVERIAEVVHTAHERGIIHRDLKPQNVMVIERAGRLLPKLLDFGIAKVVESEAASLDGSVNLEAGTPGSDPFAVDSANGADPHARTAALAIASPKVGELKPSEVATLPPEQDTTPQGTPLIARLTQAGVAVGSPPYMAPEQWVDAWSAGPRADLYSLAVVAFEALTGRRPFDATSVQSYMAQHIHGPIPALGPGHTPALDRFFQRALAKAPKDRYESALELASALRVASGLSDEIVAFPKLDETVRDAWLVDGPQPLAEAIATLDGSRNAHQARDAANDVSHGLIRYLLVLALASRAQVLGGSDDPQLIDLLRELRRRDLDDDERVRLVRLLVRPFADRKGAYPIPELVELAHRRGTALDQLDRVLQLRVSSDAGGLADDLVRNHLGQILPVLATLLRASAFVLDYPLLVPRDGAFEKWTGLRRARRPLAAVSDHAPVDHQPLLVDRDGKPAVLVWPLMQVIPPTEGSEEELFVFDGRGRRGARLVAPPAGFERNDATVWDWLAEHVVGDDQLGLATSIDDERAPYLGLSSFSSSDADRFVGREREIDAFINRLRVQPLQVIVGASGAGKSSFVHAGVVPSLPKGWRSITLRPGGNPVATLASRLAAASVASIDLDRSPAAAVASAVQIGGTLVVIVDQLEELFTLCEDEVERGRFAAMLAQLSSSVDAPLRVVCTVRDDFLMRVESLAPLRTRLASALTLLGNPSPDDLVRTIVEPARRAGYELSDPELAREMVDAIAERPGALALVSFTALRLWELRDRRFRQLTRKAYDAMGGIGGALGRHAEETLAALGADDQRLARELFRRLVTSDGTRAVLSPAELRQVLDSPRADAVIEKLVAARLIVVGDGEGESRVEIIHEALIAAWSRLQEWTREDAEGARMRDQLRAVARQWDDRRRPRGLLWRAEVLAELERWRRRPDAGALTDVETAFADASRADTRRARRIRRSIIAFAFAGLVAAIIVLGRSNAEATHQRELAETNATRAASLATDAKQRLAEQSEEQGRLALLAGRSSVGLLHFLDAIGHGAELDSALSFMIRETTRALEATRFTMKGHVGAVTSIDVLDGNRVVSAGEDGTIRIWDIAKGKQLVSVKSSVALGNARVDATGTRIVTSGKDGIARIYSIEGREQHALRTTPVGIQSPFQPAFDPTGARVATVHGFERVLRIWNTASGQIEQTFTIGDADAPFLAQRAVWSPTGETIAVIGLTGELRDARTGALRGRLSHDDGITSAAFSPDGTLVATTSFDHTTRIWDGRAGALRARLDGHADSVVVVVFDPSGQFLLTGSRDLTARIWNVRTAKLESVLDGLTGAVKSVAFDSTGALAVTATEDGVVDVWDVPRGRHLGRLEGHAEAITGVRYVGHDLVTSSNDGDVRVWRLDGMAARSITPCGEPTTFELDPAEERMVVGCIDGTARIVSADHTLGRSLEGHRTPIQKVGFLVGGRMLTLAEDRSVRVWQRDGSHESNPISTLKPSSIQITHDGRTVYAGVDRTVVVVDALSGRVRSTWIVDGVVEYLELSPDDSKLACLSDQGLDVYDTVSGSRRARYEPAQLFAFSPTGELSSVNGELVHRWDATGKVMASLRASATIRSIRYNQRGDRLVVGAANGSIQMWRDDGTLIVFPEKHLGRVIDAVFDSRDLIISIGADNTLRVWDPATTRLISAFKSHRKTVYELHMTRARTLVLANDSGGAIVSREFDPNFDLVASRDLAACAPFVLANGRAIRKVASCP